MAGTEGTTKPDADKAEGISKNEQDVPKKVRKYFLPESGQVVEADSATEAAEKVSKAKEGKKG